MAPKTSKIQQKIRKLKEKQTQWMNERQAAADIDVAKKDLESDIVLNDQRTMPINPSNSFQYDQESPQDDILHKLTEKIAIRIRDQLNQFNQNPSAITTESSTVLANHLEEYLSSELHTHCCQICFELMVPPTKSPTMLFPCGHTFCKSCTQEHQKKAGTVVKCPYCRNDVVSIAENLSLKQLIEKFASQKEKLESGKARHLNDVFPLVKNQNESQEGSALDRDRTFIDNERAKRKYLSEYQSCSVRHQILSNELNELSTSILESEQRRKGIMKASNVLQNEKEQVQNQMATLQDQLELIEKHLKEQAEKELLLDREISSWEEKNKIIRVTLSNLEAEMGKKRTLAEAVGAGEHDFGMLS